MANWKKILFAAGALVVVVVMAFIIYRTFFRPVFSPTPSITEGIIEEGELIGLPTAEGERPGAITTVKEEITPPSAPETALPPEKLPEGVSAIAKGGPTQIITLTTDRTFGTTLDQNGNGLLYYDKNLGKFNRILPDGRTETIDDRTFYNVENIYWSPNKEKTILEYPDGSNIIYNFKTKKQVTLPRHWEDFNFSPSSNEITSKSIGVDIDNRWLIISDEDGSNARAIQELQDQGDKVIVNWSPNRQMIAMYPEPVGQDRQKLYFIGQNNENFRLLVLPGLGFDGQWSPSGNQMLFSVYNAASEYKPELWITDVSPDDTGSNRRALNIKTWASKCTFADENIVYCAVPQKMETGYGYSKEFQSQTEDVFYKIDAQKGTKILIAQPYGENYAVKDIMISADRKNLFFTDYMSEKIHQLKLQP